MAMRKGNDPMADCPPRPSSERPEELGFARENRMVPWLSPRQLSRTALKVALSTVFGAYSDKREIQACIEAAPPRSYTGEVWIDFVADLGDAFGPVYTIASLLAAKTLDVGLPGMRPITTHRGQVLVMGGDQVYPTASIENYQNKVLGPYRAALPCADRDHHPHLYAVPGNHDWYDGLTAFMRVFCQDQWIGGWQTQQNRSYFALQLPHRWWLWGIDIQFESYIDAPQLRYFEEIARANLQEGDSIILCSAVPSWVHANHGECEAYGTLDYLERTVIRKKAVVRLALTGDAHHYARYEASDGTQKITAGGGGAYLSATHHLPDKLVLPPETSRDPGKTTPPAHYELKETYPTKDTSRRLCRGVVTLPFKNGSFWALLGAVHVLYAWMIQAAMRPSEQSLAAFFANLSLEDLVLGIMRSPLALLISVVLVAGLIGFTQSKVWWKRMLGALHGLAHLALVVPAVCLAAAPLSSMPGPAFLASFIALLGVGGGLLGSWLMAAYLFLADKVGCNTNELFSAQRIRDYKNVLRLKLDRTGVVTVYPIKVERTCRGWKLRREGALDDPWFEPTDGSLHAELIEQPVRVEPARSPVTADGDLREVGL
jgi:hypothetical protein